MVRTIERLLLIACTASLLILLLRLSLVFRWLLPVVLLVAGLSMLLLTVVNRWRGTLKERKIRRSPAGQVAQQIEECQQRVEKNAVELEEIRQHLADLSRNLKYGESDNAKARQEAQQLLEAFQRELGIREAKSVFFATCLEKLERLQRHHQLTRLLAEKRKRLEILRESEYQDIAELETIKSAIELEQDHLDTIDSLYRQALISNSAESLAVLQKSLEQMTEELRG
jgi:septal ring factor EnvC (AmiA/AmiB activator)